MTKPKPPLAISLSVILPLLAPEPRLEACLASFGRQVRAGDEVLMVCQGPAALAQVRELAASPGLAGLGLRILDQPPGAAGQASGAGPARAWGLAQARGRVVLFSLPHCLAGPDLLERLRQAFEAESEDGPLAGLAGGVRPAAQDGKLAALAGLELAWRRAGQDLPDQACLAFARRSLLEAGGLDPAPAHDAGDLWEAWLRLREAGQRLEHDPQCHVQAPQPATWGALLGRAQRDGQDMFLGRRLGAGRSLSRDHAGGQVVLVLAGLGVLVALWGPAPDRAWSLAAICQLLLYPFNREFIRFVAEEEPLASGTALVYCLLRPWAWGAGLLAGALRRLGSG